MDIIQNKEARIINVGRLKLKPAYPQEVDNLDELIKKYPMLKEKLSSGKIIKLTPKQAEAEKNKIEKETANRLAKANISVG